MTRSRLITVLILIIFSVINVSADETNELKVNKVELSSTDWGQQKATIEIINNAEYFKFVAARIEVIFPDARVEARRESKKTAFIQSSDTLNLEIPFVIPGNLGKGIVNIDVYDVVDTLDQLYESLKFYSQVIKFKKEIPVNIDKLIEPGIQLPGFVDQTQLFDNHITRILMLLLYRGKSLEEISKLCGVNVDFTLSLARRLKENKLLRNDNGTFRPAIRVIDNQDYDKLNPSINRTVDGLYDLIVSRLPEYEQKLEQMVKEHKLTGDKNNIFDGGSILYHRFPAILGLFLYDYLGGIFINEGKEYGPYKDASPCNGMLEQYIYLVSGSSERVGNGFYFNAKGPSMRGIYFGDRVVKLNCQKRGMVFEEKDVPVYYRYDKRITDEPMVVLTEGTAPLLKNLKDDIHKTFEKDGEYAYYKGAYLWSWFLVVDRLNKKLIKNNILIPEGSGMYVLENEED